jgi:hypothetical protein
LAAKSGAATCQKRNALAAAKGGGQQLVKNGKKYLLKYRLYNILLVNLNVIFFVKP